MKIDVAGLRPAAAAIALMLVPATPWRATSVAAASSSRLRVRSPFDACESFRAHVERILVTTLSHGDVVILDNLAATKARPCVKNERPTCSKVGKSANLQRKQDYRVIAVREGFGW
jgi:hypothetical protein